MHPAGPAPPQNRSCPSPSLAQCPSPSPLLLQQQHQQHVIYGPITTLQPSATNLHAHCVYTGVPRNPGLSVTPTALTNQVPIRHTKGIKWQPKSKLTRVHQHHNPHLHHHHHHQQNHQQQYCQPLQHQQHTFHQPFTYIPKPLVLLDQCQTNQPPSGIPPPATSFLVASSTFAHTPYGSGDPYSSATGLTLIPQPYYKPPDVPQAFCLLPERSLAPQHHQQSIPGQSQGSYYNISATNSCSLQTINAKSGFQVASVANHYASLPAFGNNPIGPGQAVPSSQLFTNPSVTLTMGVQPKDKIITCSGNLTVPGDVKHDGPKPPIAGNIDWPVQTPRETSNIFEVCGGRKSSLSSSPIRRNHLNSATLAKNQEERFSDESAASFDFTIEAEKMVSALCNTASSDLAKDDNRGRNETSPHFSGAAGDNMANKTNIWFADFCAEYGVSGSQSFRSVSTQTQDDMEDPQQYAESLRKTIYWGCNEAEGILNCDGHRGSSRAGWLTSIASATRTAVTKSSTCFPIFAGDRTFVRDLINSLLRISNGWLILDNYLNKQHYPNLSEKFDREFARRFQNWEVSTHDLMKELVKTFVNVDTKSGMTGSTILERQEILLTNSFPGDVTQYTNYDLFDSSQRHLDNFSKTGPRNDRDSTYTLHYAPQSMSQTSVRSFESPQQLHKETKLRSKWTITENLSSTIDSSIKSVPYISVNHSDPVFSGSSRFRLKNSSNTSSTKISSSARHSLNAEFFHLRNKVMGDISNSNESEKNHWGLQERQYDFVFGTSRGTNSIASMPASSESIFKIRSTGTGCENAYTRRCTPKINTALPNHGKITQCTNMNENSYLVSGTETAIDSTYIAAAAAISDCNKTYTEPDYTGVGGMSECTEHNCGSDLVVSTTTITSIASDPVYVGKSSSEQRQLAAVPRTKMTLLSQIEGTTPTASRDTKEMTAHLSAWFASMRNAATGHQAIACPVEGRKNENIFVTRTSTHPQDTSRSAMDLNRQLHMDGNRQLLTLQNMQTIQSQPWNALNLLNSKLASANVQHLDEYDSSEDVRVYMKPGSYNVPKKRNQRKNNRRNDNPGSSRATSQPHTNRGGQGESYNSSTGNNNQIATPASSVVLTSSVQVSTTSTCTSTTIRVPFPATPIVQPPPKFALESTAKVLRRINPCSNEDNRQDVAWKAACASAEILLEALNVKEPTELKDRESEVIDCEKNIASNCEASNQDEVSIDPSSSTKNIANHFCEASSYEASEDDSDSTCKLSPCSDFSSMTREIKQPKTNVKTDSWLIKTLNNASIVSKIQPEESDAESTIGGSLNSSIHEGQRRQRQVVTSTPEPMKMGCNEIKNEFTNVAKNLTDSFPEKSISENSRGSKKCELSNSATRQTVSASLGDMSQEFVGKATYSETVRRSTGKSSSSGKKESCRSRQTKSAGLSAATVTGRKYQRKDNDKTYQLIHKCRRTIGKRLSRGIEENNERAGSTSKRTVKEVPTGENCGRILAVKTQVKKKENNNVCTGWIDTKTKTSDRGWSVWYSSRRKQTLSSVALNKLVTIHQAVWQMDGAQVLKYPSATAISVDSFSGTIDDYCKIIKSPMFLETIGYKLKNRIYHKVEHVIRDFRKIVNHSKLYYKNDPHRISKVDILSKKLEDLIEEHFSSWDFENAVDSQGDDNASPRISTSTLKSSQQQQKPAASKLTGTTKKNSSIRAKNDN